MNYQKQANDFLTNAGIKFSVSYVGFKKHFAGDTQKRHVFKCVFRRSKHSFSLEFGQSIMKGAAKPTAYDVLAYVQKYDVGSFEEFCNEFGYELYTESPITGNIVQNKQAKRLYNAVCKEYENVSRFFTEAEIELLQEIQ